MAISKGTPLDVDKIEILMSVGVSVTIPKFGTIMNIEPVLGTPKIYRAESPRGLSFAIRYIAVVMHLFLI